MVRKRLQNCPKMVKHGLKTAIVDPFWDRASEFWSSRFVRALKLREAVSPVHSRGSSRGGRGGWRSAVGPFEIRVDGSQEPS